MDELLHLACISNSHLFSPLLHPRQCPSSPSSSSSSLPSPRRPLPRAAALRCASSLLPYHPTLAPPTKPPNRNPNPSQEQEEDEVAEEESFQEKVLYLDSLGVDLLAAASAHPQLLSTPLAELRATADFLLAAGGLSGADLRRVCGMCPEVLAAGGPRALAPVFAFLVREAGVDGLPALRRALRRRPRLLVSDVASRLRPTLYFLQMLRVPHIGLRHASLLSCSVEDKLLPRLHFLQGVGFSPREARAMVRRFPQLFCYSVAGNLEPKFDFFAVEMRRSLAELREFPQFFSFSLRDRIIPRHRRCAELGVSLPLPALLKPGEDQFAARLLSCVSSSPPLRRSPLWCDRFSD
ncbi:mitochondrial transcription termination factor family protein [Wolffia australiana]